MSNRGVVKMVQQYFPQVTKVADAKRDLTVEVTPRDVAVSKRYKHAECAMAVACKRAKHMTGVIVSRSKVYLIKGDKALRYQVPESVAREVVSFDRGGGFEPGTYGLKRPARSRKLGNPGGGGKRIGNGRPLKRVHMTGGIRAILGSKQAEAES